MAFKRTKAAVATADLRQECSWRNACENTHSSSQIQAVRAELVGDSTCSAAGITTHGQAPILALCRELLALGLDPDRAMEVYRRGSLALKVRSIGEGAKLEVNSKGTDFVPFRAVRTASPVRQNRVAATTLAKQVPA
jgi:hypothetical protein